MNKFFRGIIAAWGAKKLGGGCLSTIIIFIVIYTLLGKCNNQPRAATPVAKPHYDGLRKRIWGELHPMPQQSGWPKME